MHSRPRYTRIIGQREQNGRMIRAWCRFMCIVATFCSIILLFEAKDASDVWAAVLAGSFSIGLGFFGKE